MKKTREEVLADVQKILERLNEDWENDAPVTRETYLLRDLGFQSIDVAILSSSVQEHYNVVLPFSEFFDSVAQSGRTDVSVGEWVDFIYEQLYAERIKV